MIKILLSPAKSLNSEGNLKKPFTTQAHFLKEANQLAKKMQKISSNKLEEMMHISKDLADLNKFRYDNWVSPEVEKNFQTERERKKSQLHWEGEMVINCALISLILYTEE